MLREDHRQQMLAAEMPQVRRTSVSLSDEKSLENLSSFQLARRIRYGSYDHREKSPPRGRGTTATARI